MLFKAIFGFTIILCICSCQGVDLPAFIKKCYQNDPDVNKCLLERSNEVLPRFSKGVPELGIQRLDPMYFDVINTTSNNIQLLLLNTTLKGLSKTKISKFTIDMKKNVVMFKMSYYPHMTGKYKLSGKILLINLQGDGDYVFKLGRTNCSVQYKHKFTVKNGEKYGSLNNETLKCTFEKGSIHFKNLFNGNKLLGDTVNTVLNDNYEAVMKQGAQPAIDAINENIIESLEEIYKRVPFEVIFPKKPPENE